MVRHPSLFRQMMRTLVHTDAWTWIGFLFGLQTAGALAVTAVLRLDMREVGPAVGLLLLGMVHALVCRWRACDHTNKAWHPWFPALIYAAFIFFLSHQPFSEAVTISFDTSFFHPLEYATFAVLLCWIWRPVLTARGVFPFLARVLSVGLLYGILDELHQAFIPGRNPTFTDIALDFVGLCVGCAVFLVGRTIHGRLRETFGE